MKLILTVIIATAGLFLVKPELFAQLPLPTDEAWEQRQLDGYAKRCLPIVIKKVETQVHDRLGLTGQQFASLIRNKTFQASFCACESEIVRYNRMVPSNYLPKSFQVSQLRVIASKMKSHLQTGEGMAQSQYCFQEAWNKAAFSY